MNFEPQKFFIGLIDFFSILLPGALLTFLLKDDLGVRLLGAVRYREVAQGSPGWIAFLFSSYLLGHFVFLLGAGLLDEHVYDRIRRATIQGQTKRLAKDEGSASPVARWLAARMVPSVSDQAVDRAVLLKEHYLTGLEASSAINAFQWCKARLALEQPEALATVQRFEADSKFFRSLLVVLAIVIPWGLIEGQPAIALVGGALMVLAFWRYVDQRVKATNQAYWYIITLEGSRTDARVENLGIRAEEASHAGGVVFKGGNGSRQYLLVQAKDAPGEWVLPKGHIERGERAAEAAVREVREEAGLWARIVTPLGMANYTAGGDRVAVQYYVMEKVAKTKRTDTREQRWLSLKDALHLATHDETKKMLAAAEDSEAATRRARSSRGTVLGSFSRHQ
jgi:8-oxo-dGTP pyrophosphatase MutT (NUDIX family)